MDGDVQKLTHGNMLAELRRCQTAQCMQQKKHSTAIAVLNHEYKLKPKCWRRSTRRGSIARSGDFC
jgi:hypothetical protein